MQVFLMEALLENYENNDSFLNVVSFQKQKNRIIFELLLVILFVILGVALAFTSWTIIKIDNIC